MKPGGKLSTKKREGFTRRYAGKGSKGKIGKENRRIGVKTKENILNSKLIRKRGKKGGKDKNGKKRGEKGKKGKKRTLNGFHIFLLCLKIVQVHPGVSQRDCDRGNIH